MQPDNNYSDPPDHWCQACGKRWAGEREFCPHCGARIGKRRFQWSCAIIVLLAIAVIFGCVGACSLVVFLQSASGPHNEYSDPIGFLVAIVGLVAFTIMAALIFGAMKMGRRP